MRAKALRCDLPLALTIVIVSPTCPAMLGDEAYSSDSRTRHRDGCPESRAAYGPLILPRHSHWAVNALAVNTRYFLTGRSAACVLWAAKTVCSTKARPEFSPHVRS
jgi:hypothetical protein